jgi:hypothetical protein
MNINDPSAVNDPNRLPDIAFDAAEDNGHASKTDAASVVEAGFQKPALVPKKTMFESASRRSAELAKKGSTSSSRTGKAKQVSYEFCKPPKNTYIKTHPSPSYHAYNLPTYVNEISGKFSFIPPALSESGDLPARFQGAIKLMDVHTAGLADGSFLLWYVFVSASPWRKSAEKVVEAAALNFGIVDTIRQRQTYTWEPACDPIAEPKWASLPDFESLLMGAYDNIIHVADDKTVTDFMSGGVAADRENEDNE